MGNAQLSKATFDVISEPRSAKSSDPVIEQRSRLTSLPARIAVTMSLAGISATGQEKIKKGFEPMVPGFRHVSYNDLNAMRAAISPATVAILVEGIQGEGGVTPVRLVVG